MDTADLDRAVMGVYRSAFGMGGQKCSACSRAYVHEQVYDEFVGRLVKRAQETVVGDPLDKRTSSARSPPGAATRTTSASPVGAESTGRILTGCES